MKRIKEELHIRIDYYPNGHIEDRDAWDKRYTESKYDPEGIE